MARRGMFAMGACCWCGWVLWCTNRQRHVELAHGKTSFGVPGQAERERELALLRVVMRGVVGRRREPWPQGTGKSAVGEQSSPSDALCPKQSQLFCQYRIVAWVGTYLCTMETMPEVSELSVWGPARSEEAPETVFPERKRACLLAYERMIFMDCKKRHRPQIRIEVRVHVFRGGQSKSGCRTEPIVATHERGREVSGFVMMVLWDTFASHARESGAA